MIRRPPVKEEATMTSLNNVSLDFKVFDCTAKEEKVNQFLAFLHDPEIKSVLNLYLENFLATSDLRILKRLAAIEATLGLDDMESDEELSIPARLDLLSDKIDATIIKTPNLEPVQVCSTKTESRAYLLVQRLKSLKIRKHLDSKEIVQFLKYGIDERFRAKDGQNVRQIKKEVLEKAENLFRGEVELNKRKHGRREVRLILT